MDAPKWKIGTLGNEDSTQQIEVAFGNLCRCFGNGAVIAGNHCFFNLRGSLAFFEINHALVGLAGFCFAARAVVQHTQVQEGIRVFGVHGPGTFEQALGTLKLVGLHGLVACAKQGTLGFIGKFLV